MPFTQPWFEVDFGSAYAGIGTTGYRLYQATGADSVARTTTGVVDLGNGGYGVAAVNVPDNAVGVEWDTGGGSPVFAREDVERDRLLEAAAIEANVEGHVDDALIARRLDELLDQQASIGGVPAVNSFWDRLTSAGVNGYEFDRLRHSLESLGAATGAGRAYDVTGAPSSTVIQTTCPVGNSIYNIPGMYELVHFDADSNTVHARAITAYSQTNGQFTIDSAFPNDPEEADDDKVWVRAIPFQSRLDIPIAASTETRVTNLDNLDVPVSDAATPADVAAALEAIRLDELIFDNATANAHNFSFLGLIMNATTSSTFDRTFASLEALGARGTLLPNRGDFASLLTIAGSSTTEIRTDADEADGYWDNHTLVVQDNLGAVGAGTITGYLNTNGAFTVDPPLPFTPGVGAVCYVTPGGGSGGTTPQEIWDHVLPGTSPANSAGERLATTDDALVTLQTTVDNLNDVSTADLAAAIATDPGLIRVIQRVSNRVSLNPSNGVVTVYNDAGGVALTGLAYLDIAQLNLYDGSGPVHSATRLT